MLLGPMLGHSNILAHCKGRDDKEVFFWFWIPLRVILIMFRKFRAWFSNLMVYCKRILVCEFPSMV